MTRPFAIFLIAFGVFSFPESLVGQSITVVDDGTIDLRGWVAPFEQRDDLTIDAQKELWETINNSLASTDVRIQAERSLMRARDVRMLPIVFQEFNAPIEVIHLPDPNTGQELRIETMSRRKAIMLHFPSGGSPEADARAPVAAQIAYARGRILSYLLELAEPEDERRQMYAALFDDAQSEWQVHAWITSSNSNWTDEVRDRLIELYKNANHDIAIRFRAGHALLDMHHTTPVIEQRQINEQLIATAWKERRSAFALRVGQRLGMKDPRVAALKLDVYDHEVQKAGHTTPSAVHLIDTYFDNVSGLYLNPRSAEGHRQWIKYRDQRMALQMEASETGDDTKLREFEEEHAEKQRRELELRIERIDAWIAENRERLEREAEEFAEQRQRERELAE